MTTEFAASPHCPLPPKLKTISPGPSGYEKGGGSTFLPVPFFPAGFLQSVVVYACVCKCAWMYIHRCEVCAHDSGVFACVYMSMACVGAWLQHVCVLGCALCVCVHMA